MLITEYGLWAQPLLAYAPLSLPLFGLCAWPRGARGLALAYNFVAASQRTHVTCGTSRAFAAAMSWYSTLRPSPRLRRYLWAEKPDAPQVFQGGLERFK